MTRKGKFHKSVNIGQHDFGNRKGIADEPLMQPPRFCTLDPSCKPTFSPQTLVTC